MGDCPFCVASPERMLVAGRLAMSISDAYPVSPGHTLIIPKRHVASFFEATDEERSELLALLDSSRLALIRRYRPSGFNVGINDGSAAGQTVMHLHIHLIPRYLGDKPDPRGGVRWIFPEKADYWSLK